MRFILFRKAVSIVLFLALLCCGVGAQIEGNSPFSRFGIGNLTSPGFMHLKQMGGISSSYYDAHHLNFDNPATLSRLLGTSFDVGAYIHRADLSDSDAKGTVWGGNLSYLALGFSLRNQLNEVFSNKSYNFNWGMGFALEPISNIGFDLSKSESVDGIGEYIRQYTGNGGFYKAVWANSAKIGDFSVGFNVGYLFGKDKFTRHIDFVDQTTAFDNNFSVSYDARGAYFDMGVLYTILLNKADMNNTSTVTESQRLSLGLTYKPNISFTSTGERLDINVFQASAQDVLVDTLRHENFSDVNGTLPSELGLGVTYYHENKYALGLDIKRVNWSNYVNEAKPEQLSDTWRMALGGYMRPQYNSITSFWKRMYYRFGIFYEQDPREIKNSRIDGYGVTMGLGFPFAWQRKWSHLNLGVTLGHRSADNVLTENYIRINFGFTFNDNEWFYKRKYN